MPPVEVATAPPNNHRNGARVKPRKRLSKKEKRERRQREEEEERRLRETLRGTTEPTPDDVEVEYVTPEIKLEGELEEFAEVFAKFSLPNSDSASGADKGTSTADGAADGETGDASNAQAENEENQEAYEEPEVKSKKQLKKLNRLTVAELKQLVAKPEVVEWVDVTAADPQLLVALKSYRNTVPVPAHWSQKRKYLQNKRGIEKPPFELPDFIKDTGIMEMRQAIRDKEEQQKLKAKTRERLQPKLGKLEIDYQKLHDAFFKFQTKPPMTIHGDL
jgi:splicing factor 3B subunit 2